MAVARALQQLQQLNEVLQHQHWPRLYAASCDLRAAIMEDWSPVVRSQQVGTPAERAALARLTVEVAERLVQAEAAGTLLSLGILCVACAALAASSCAMLASYCSLGPADSARVASVAALALGSGRSVMQGAALLNGAALADASGLVCDLLDTLHYCVVLMWQHDLLDDFSRDVVPPSRMVGWLRDAAAVLNRLGRLSRADVGPLVSHLTAYTCVLALSLCAEQQPCIGVQGALADANILQTLLLALTQALPALRGECNPLHTREVWQLLFYAGSILQFTGEHGPDAARRTLLSISTRRGGPVAIELVRDVAVALPPSPPAGVPLGSYAGACIVLCNALMLLPAPDAEGSGNSEAGGVPPSSADWAAVEAFAVLGPAICRAALPPNLLPSDQMLEAGHALYGASIRLLPLLRRAPGSCSPHQLQLMFEAAWQVARQLPLLLAAFATEAAHTEERLHELGVVSLALLDPLIASALELAAPVRSSAASSGQAPSQEVVANAALGAGLLQRTHVRLCKMAQFLLAAAPAEQQEVRAAVAAAKQTLSFYLAQSFSVLQLAHAWSARGGGRQGVEGAPVQEESVSLTQESWLAHTALQWEAVQALASQGALQQQAASVASGFQQDAPCEVTVLYHSFIHLLAASPGALRGSPWIQLVMPVFVRHFRNLHKAAHKLAEEDEFFASITSLSLLIHPNVERQEVLREAEVDILAFALQRLSVDGGLAAEFLSHPRLPALLDQAASTSASDKKFGAQVEQLSAALHSMLAVATAVAAAGSIEEGSGSSQSAQVPAGQLAELAAAAASLQAAMEAASFPAPPSSPSRPALFPFVLPTWVAAHGPLFQGMAGSSGAGSSGQAAAAAASSHPAPKASIAAFQKALLPCAKRLAAGLLPLWPPPGQQQAERLELGRAVAACTSGCSNLRCPDWQGQCRKPLRCSGCKQARFCNAACQADAWRHGGHKYVCKLLAAAAAGRA